MSDEERPQTPTRSPRRPLYPPTKSPARLTTPPPQFPTPSEPGVFFENSPTKSHSRMSSRIIPISTENYTPESSNVFDIPNDDLSFEESHYSPTSTPPTTSITQSDPLDPGPSPYDVFTNPESQSQSQSQSGDVESEGIESGEILSVASPNQSVNQSLNQSFSQSQDQLIYYPAPIPQVLVKPPLLSNKHTKLSHALKRYTLPNKPKWGPSPLEPEYWETRDEFGSDNDDGSDVDSDMATVSGSEAESEEDPLDEPQPEQPKRANFLARLFKLKGDDPDYYNMDDQPQNLAQEEDDIDATLAFSRMDLETVARHAEMFHIGGINNKLKRPGNGTGTPSLIEEIEIRKSGRKLQKSIMARDANRLDIIRDENPSGHPMSQFQLPTLLQLQQLADSEYSERAQWISRAVNRNHLDVDDNNGIPARLVDENKSTIRDRLNTMNGSIGTPLVGGTAGSGSIRGSQNPNPDTSLSNVPPPKEETLAERRQRMKRGKETLAERRARLKAEKLKNQQTNSNEQTNRDSEQNSDPDQQDQQMRPYPEPNHTPNPDWESDLSTGNQVLAN